MSQKVVPYVRGSVNLGFNRPHELTQTPLLFQALPNANFANNTKTAVSYTVDSGTQTPLNNHRHSGIGYEFLDFGKVVLIKHLGRR